MVRAPASRGQWPHLRSPALRLPLPEPVWENKRRIITDIYGFGPEDWEPLVTPKVEAFNPLGT